MLGTIREPEGARVDIHPKRKDPSEAKAPIKNCSHVNVSTHGFIPFSEKRMNEPDTNVVVKAFWRILNTTTQNFSLATCENVKATFSGIQKIPREAPWGAI
jgi:hypothetical protein